MENYTMESLKNKKKSSMDNKVLLVYTIIFMTFLFCILFLIKANIETKAEDNNYSSMVPTNLRINGLEDNCNAMLLNNSVSFSWKYNGTNGTYQKKYKVLVYEERNDEITEIYNSGYVPTKQNSGVFLDGLQLEKGRIYFWKVKTVDSNDVESEYSKVDSFVTQMDMSYNEWKSIWGKPSSDNPESYCDYVFIRSNNFSVNKANLERVVISVAGKGTLEDRSPIGNLYFNGEILGIAGPEMKKIGTKFVCYYSSYDITNMVTENNNVVSLTGYCRDKGKGFFVDVTAYYSDGSKITYLTSNNNNDWIAMDGDVGNAFNYARDEECFTFPSSYMTNDYFSMSYENVNSVTYPSFFYDVDYSVDSRWQTAIICERESSHSPSNIYLEPYISENVVGNIVEPKNIYIKDRNVIVEFSEQTYGILRVSINMPDDVVLPIYQGYEYDDNKEIEYILGAGFEFSTKWSMKKGENNFDTINYKDFKYIQINCGQLTTISEEYIKNNIQVEVIEMRKEFDETKECFKSSFTSSNKFLNNFYDASKTTYKQTAFDIMMDSTERERAPYTADSFLNVALAHMFTCNYTYERHTNEFTINDAMYKYSTGSWPGDYKLMNIWNVYNEYMVSGDVEWLRNNYSLFKDIIKKDIQYEDSKTGFVKSKSNKFGTNGSLVDWPRTEISMPMGFDDEGYYNVPYLCELTYTYKTMANISRVLGKTSDCVTYTNKCLKLKTNIIKYCYNSSTGRMYDSVNKDLKANSNHVSMHSTAYALACEIYNTESMAKKMAKNIYNDNKNGYACSIYFTYFVLKGLYNAGEGGYAYNLLIAKDTKYSGNNSFYNMYHKIMTYDGNDNTYNGRISPEVWDKSQKTNCTFSHPWGTSSGIMIAQGIFGIKPLSAGENFMEVKLQPGDLKNASLTVPTVQGALTISFENSSNNISGSITIPENMKVRLILPHKNLLDKIMINGDTYSQKETGTFTYVELTSGSYVFEK